MYKLIVYQVNIWYCYYTKYINWFYLVRVHAYLTANNGNGAYFENEVLNILNFVK